MRLGSYMVDIYQGKLGEAEQMYERALRGNYPTFGTTTRFTSLLIVDFDEVKELLSYACKDCTATRGVVTKTYLCISVANQDEST
jgi:hypothetical protein